MALPPQVQREVNEEAARSKKGDLPGGKSAPAVAPPPRPVGLDDVGPAPQLEDFPGDNQGFTEALTAWEIANETKIPAAAWEGYVLGRAIWEINNAAAIFGFDADPYITWLNMNSNLLLNGIMPNAQKWREEPERVDVNMMRTWGDMAVWWLKGQFPELADALGQPAFTTSRGRGSGRRGASRADFDVEELARGANQLWQAYLIEDAPDARGLAESYINQVLKNPLQRLDFESFVKGKIEKTARYALMDERRPEGLTYEQWIGDYTAKVRSILGPGEDGQVGRIIQSAAQLASSDDELSGRLRRERQVKTSAPFIQGLEAQLLAVKDVFRGS
jgi:hypothetical protein